MGIDRKSNNRPTLSQYFNAVVGTLMLIKQRKYKAKQIAARLGVEDRSVTRYIKVLEDLGIPIERGFDNTYFIVDCKCPVCNNEMKDNDSKPQIPMGKNNS